MPACYALENTHLRCSKWDGWDDADRKNRFLTLLPFSEPNCPPVQYKLYFVLKRTQLETKSNLNLERMRRTSFEPGYERLNVDTIKSE